MNFTKMHGAGNDFIILDITDGHVTTEDLHAIAKRLCTRRLSIGADGLMAVSKPEKGGDFRMYFFNSDGSRGEMCGNGARCIARYGYEHGFSGETQRIETDAGLVIGTRVSERLYTVRLNDPSVIKENVSLQLSDGRQLLCTYIELGSPGIPHAVVPFNELDTINDDVLRSLGREIRYCSSFPKGANVNFFKILGVNDILLRTYERGVEDFTLACGTGSGSTATALTIAGFCTGNNVRLTMPGGELFVTLTHDNGNIRDIFLTGPTDIVAEGTVRDEDLEY